MPLLHNKQDKPFAVFIAANIDINHAALNEWHQNIIVMTEKDDILKGIESTQFSLILLDLAVISYSTIIPRIKNPFSINNKTPLIAIIPPTDDFQNERQGPLTFDDVLIAPITEQRLNEIIELWQAKALAEDYIQIMLAKTKNNQQLARTLFEKLFDELPSQVTGIKEALNNAQFDLAREITHKLNGSVSFCGLLDIQQAASTLESCLLNNKHSCANQLFLAMQRYVLNFTRHQKLILANLKKLTP